jgi:hypothetical protein
VGAFSAPGSIEYGYAAGKVCTMSCTPFQITAFYRCDRCEMEAAVHATHRPGDNNRICDIAFDKVCCCGLVLDPAGGHVIEDAHQVAICNKRIGEMRADKTASASYEIAAHEITILFMHDQRKNV